MSRYEDAVTAGLLGVLSAVAWAVPAGAAEWSIDRSVSLIETYTDNINLSHTNPKSRFVTQVTPRLSVKGRGARANLDLTASVRYDNGGGGAGSLTPRLAAKGDTELITNHLVVEGDASITRNAIDPFGAIGIDDINRTSNVTTTYQFGVSPVYRDRIKGVGDLTARYRLSGISHSGVSGSTGLHHNADVSVSDTVGKTTWRVGADYTRTDSRNGGGIDGSLGYQINRKWMIDGSIGREWNNYTSTRSSRGGFRWSTNVTWTPNARTKVRVGYGDRFFGSTPSLDISYRHRRSTLTASYSKTVTDANSVFQALAFDPVTNRIFPVAIIRDDVFVDERFTGTYSLKGKRTTLTLSATRSTQEYENSPQSSTLTKLGGSLSRRFPGRSTVSTSLNWYQQERSSADSAEIWQASIAVNKPIGEKTSVGVSYTYNLRDGDVASGNYEENRVAVTLTHDF